MSHDQKCVYTYNKKCTCKYITRNIYPDITRSPSTGLKIPLCSCAEHHVIDTAIPIIIEGRETAFNGF